VAQSDDVSWGAENSECPMLNQGECSIGESPEDVRDMKK
jgi:hypothetical protein